MLHFLTIQTAELNRLGNVLGKYIFAPSQIGNGAADFQDTVIGPGREAELVHGLFEQVMGRGIKKAELFQVLVCHLAVAEYFFPFLETFFLDLPGPADPFPDCSG